MDSPRGNPSLAGDHGWELRRRLPLAFPTHHPQGLTFADGRTFLSSVEVLEAPAALPSPPGTAPGLSPACSSAYSPGRGIGHIFVVDSRGVLVRDVRVGRGDIYHPGGIDFDGTSIWFPVAEYRPRSNSVISTLDPVTLEVRERFRVKDHVGWAVHDPESGLVRGGGWGSRRFYTWTSDGVEVSLWDNPGSFVDYQDCQYVGPGRALCSGLSVLPFADGQSELGGVALVDFARQQILQETPVRVVSSAGHV
ncbi:DUF6454 family protein, partial [Arthrobacter sp. B3I4]|uniref:DUF6454 family protein n=1 Tax=Arthrobacter sp. B3I4 TaxID=3042267 RepID=UPI0027882B6E